jgi:sugar phosphate isomerase/epimerase
LSAAIGLARAGFAAEAPHAGIQLWTVRDALAADFAGTLRRLRDIGFTEVEPAGLMGHSARELRALLDDAGLTAPSAHLDLGGDAVDAAFDDAHALGARYVVSAMLRPGSAPSVYTVPAGGPPPGVPPPTTAMTLADAKLTAELANRVGARAKRAGLQYAYHNHDFEFAPQANGTIAYDELLRQTDPELVKLELDCGWMVVGGRDPVDYLERHPGRFPLLHVKDFLPAQRDARAPRLGAELGHGTIDYAPILAAARKSGLEHAFAEQEGPYTRMSQLDAARVAHEYLKGLAE